MRDRSQESSMQPTHPIQPATPGHSAVPGQPQLPAATERLLFRTWTLADRDLARSLWTDPEVMRHMGGAATPAAADQRLQQEIDRQARLGFQYWPIFLRTTGQFAGCAGLRCFHPETPDRQPPQELEVGVHLARPCWSLRLGEEAARAVIDHAFDVLGVESLMAGHGPAHTDSQALILRLGFVYAQHVVWGPLQALHPFYRLRRSDHLLRRNASSPANPAAL